VMMMVMGTNGSVEMGEGRGGGEGDSAAAVESREGTPCP
jgi:hypothetical protein